MAFYCTRCQDCQSPKKKCVKKTLKDTDGKKFTVQMYECDDLSCELNRKRVRSQRELKHDKGHEKGSEGVLKDEKNNHNRSRAR